MVSNDATEQFLNAPFLAELDPSSRQALLEVLVEQCVPAGSVLLRQGDPNNRIYFLIEGTVAISRTIDQGRSEHLLDLHAPTTFGEVAYFQRKPQLVTASAATDLRVLILEREAHERLRESHPRVSEQLAMAAIRVLAGHFDLIDRRIAELVSRQPDPQTEATEWERFRASLFGGSKL